MLAELRALAGRNRVLASMIGLGYHDTITPPVIRRNILENPAWYTAYTPYQPEISQGRLEALLNFQTMVADLTGPRHRQRLAARRGHRRRRGDGAVPPGVEGARRRGVRRRRRLPSRRPIAVVATRAEPLGLAVVVADVADDGLPDGDVFGVLVQYPGVERAVVDWTAVDRRRARARRAGGGRDRPARAVPAAPAGRDRRRRRRRARRSASACRWASAARTPASWRCATARSARCPAGSSACRSTPTATPAYRLALQTREQHIRREKATSNICTAQVLLAVMASMYAVYHGPDGLTAIAERVHATARSRRGAGAGRSRCTTTFFDTVQLRVPGRAAAVVAAARDERHQPAARRRRHRRHRLRRDDDRRARRDACATVVRRRRGRRRARGRSPAPLRRDDQFLTHPVFHEHRSETAMLRYLRRLADKDLALDRSMIPLGSCTMKLNATAEMEPITWPGFAGIHPFAPLDQADGYRALIADLERWLVRDHRLRRRVAAAERRLAGRARRPARHPRVASQPRRRRPRRVPHPVVGPRHQRGVGGDGRHAGRGRARATTHGNVDLDDLRAKLDRARAPTSPR